MQCRQCDSYMRLISMNIHNIDIEFEDAVYVCDECNFMDSINFSDYWIKEIKDYAENQKNIILEEIREKKS